jgi:hypothetical protein
MPDGSEFSVIERILELLEQTTSLRVVSDFLRAKNLHHSAGNWEDMREKRLRRYLESGEITVAGLTDLLRSVEECGCQHIFLFQTTPERAQEIMDRARVADVLTRRGLHRLLTAADVLLQPAAPQIVDVRWESAEVDLAFIVKEIELRTHRKYLGEESEGDRFYKVYTNEQQRAVNVAKLHRDGLLEIRIAAHRGSKYQADVDRFIVHLAEILPFAEFGEVALDMAKDKLLAERKTTSRIVRYTNATVCDGEGNFMHAITATDGGDLADAPAIGRGLDALLENDEDAYCSDSNMWFIQRHGLSADIHVLLDGEVNEFVIPAHCGPQDYNYVLNTIRRFNA